MKDLFLTACFVIGSALSFAPSAEAGSFQFSFFPGLPQDCQYTGQNIAPTIKELREKANESPQCQQVGTVIYSKNQGHIRYLFNKKESFVGYNVKTKTWVEGSSENVRLRNQLLQSLNQ